MRILVTGATGYVGSRLVTELLAQRHEVHEVLAASRNPARLKRFGWFDDVIPIDLDASDPVSAHAAFALSRDTAGPVDVVYYLVHGIGQPGFRDADRTAAANVAAAARDAGVRRIVYLGGFVPHDEALSEHLASRAEVAQALTVEGGPELVWLGAAMIIGAGSTSFEMMRYVGDRFPLIPMPGWMDNPIEPISIRDVLHYLVASANIEADVDQVPAGAYDIYRAGHHVLPGSAQNVCAHFRAVARRCAGAPGRHHGGVTDHRARVAGASRPGRRPGRVAGPPDAGVRHRPARSGARSARGPAQAWKTPSRCRWRGRTTRRGRSTPWPIPIAWPTPIPRGPAATCCASGGSPAR